MLPPTIDLDNWVFSYPTRPPYQGPTLVVSYATALDLLRTLGTSWRQHAAIQGRVQDRLAKDPNRIAWHRQRTLLKNAPHFRRYRGRFSHEYHAAALVVASGSTPSARELSLVTSLNAEIQMAGFMLPKGQRLFHGTANQPLKGPGLCPAFISTTLDPVVAVNHAKKRTHHNPSSRATVYLLSVQQPISAFYGQAGKTAEFELLLPTMSTVVQTAVHSTALFDIVEASIA